MRSEGAVQDKVMAEVSELERTEMREAEKAEVEVVEVKEEGQESTFAELMNAEFICQFKGCWCW
jgi:hypothetical protein